MEQYNWNPNNHPLNRYRCKGTTVTFSEPDPVIAGDTSQQKIIKLLESIDSSLKSINAGVWQTEATIDGKDFGS